MSDKVKITWVSRYDYEPDNEMELIKHKHNFCQIIYFVKGKSRFTYIDKLYDVLDKTIYFINPNEYHQVIHNFGDYVVTLDVKFMINDYSLKNLARTYLSGRYKSDDVVYNMLNELVHVARDRKRFSREICENLLENIIYRLLQIRMNVSDNSTKLYDVDLKENVLVKKVIDYLESNYSKKISLDDLASDLSYNKSYLCQLFKKNSELTISQYLNNIRIYKSLEYLAISEKSIEEIALLTGFSNRYYFTKVFSAIMGISPVMWRKREISGILDEVYFE